MIQGGAANILQRPVTVSLDSSDGPAVGGAQGRSCIALRNELNYVYFFPMQPLQTMVL